MGGELYPHQAEFEDEGFQCHYDLKKRHEVGVELLKKQLPVIKPIESISGITLWSKNIFGEYVPRELK